MAVTNYDAAQWLLEGAKESAEVDYDVEVDDELLKQWDEFAETVSRALRDPWGPLTEEEMDEVEAGEGIDSVAIDVYHTITGAGVDVADGRWDGYLGGSVIGSIKAEKVAEYLRAHKGLGSWADESGAGRLNDALWEAVFVQRPRGARGSTRRSMQRRKQPKRNPRSVIAKFLKGI